MNVHHRPSVFRGVLAILAGCSLFVIAAPARAGGSPENALLIIDPSNSDSLYVGNYYRNARNIPEKNVLYMAPGATSYAAFADVNLDALFGTLANSAIDDHIDYIVLMPGSPFFIDAPGYVSDACYAVTRCSISAAYSGAFIADEILAAAPNFPSSTANRYYRGADDVRAFDSSLSWLSGLPSTNASARRYFIGALLGYNGAYGNTLAQTLTMIDRSVAADGTRPAGTFYYVQTTDTVRSGPRDPYYSAAVTSIQGLGGQAALINSPPLILPLGHYDCLGVMTGWDTLPIESADMTILPGAFGDHLTSWAATFDTQWQTKVSSWITKGASGSWGTVQEPCNYPGKFPHARLHVFYDQGLSLGEAAFRSVAYFPFEGLLYGDPLTRPFAYLPSVAVNDAPTGPVSRNIVLTPTATTAHPTATIASFDLLIDGVLFATTTPGGLFSVGTRSLADGWHDLRVLAYDNSLAKSTGRWTGPMTVNNHGRAVTLNPAPPSGNWATHFTFNVTATGSTPTEVRVVQNGRVLAAAPGASAALTVDGLTLGAGPARVQAEALFVTGGAVRSAPIDLNIAYAAGTPSGQAPVAYSYTRRVRKDQPFVVELPATFDDGSLPLTFTLLTNPVQAAVPAGQSGPYRLMRPNAGAKGFDSFTFRVTSAAGNSNVATVTLDYGVLRGDVNCDGLVDLGDINAYVMLLSTRTAWQANYPNCPLENGDINGDGSVDFGDINPYVALLSGN